MEYTVKDIAYLLDISKPTVQKVINRLGIEADRIEKNKFRYYSQEKTEAIIKEIKADFDLSQLSKTTANTENICDNTAKFIDKPQTDNETMARMLDLLQAEIQKKDRELERKDKQIESLQTDLKQAYNQVSEQAATIATMAQQASYITAADKTAQIIDKQAAAAEEPQEEAKPKKKFFSFFKK